MRFHRPTLLFLASLALGFSLVSAASADGPEPRAATDNAEPEGEAPPDGETEPTHILEPPHDRSVAQSLRPFVRADIADRFEQRAELALALDNDRRAIEAWDGSRRRRHKPLTLELPNRRLTELMASRLHQSLRSIEDDSEASNETLAVLLLARPETPEGLLLAIRALSSELARLRGEPPSPLVVVATSVFALENAAEIERMDPRHRIGLLEALLETRDFAGLERATRGYEGHGLQEHLARYRRATEFETRSVEIRRRVAEEIAQPPEEPALQGMYFDSEKNYVWIAVE